MKICIEIENIERIQETIAGVERYLDGEELASDFQHLVGVLSIMTGIQAEFQKQIQGPNR